MQDLRDTLGGVFGLEVGRIHCLEFAMIRKRPDSGWRAMALAAALFAVTLNFLQPLAHAALLRDGSPAAMWTVFCISKAPGVYSGSESAPAPAAEDHECCLGLPHAQTLIEPLATFLPVVFAASVLPPLQATEQPTPVGIRDGPHRPRGPPSLD
jgi:hypothetical protein